MVESAPRLLKMIIAKRQALELFQMFANDPLIDQLELRRYILEAFNAKTLINCWESNKLNGEQVDLGQILLQPTWSSRIGQGKDLINQELCRRLNKNER